MPIITADELTLLRTISPGVRADTYASFLKPLTLWSAQINSGSLTRGDYSAIPFDGGSGLDWSAVEAYQEIWIGTTAGANDVATLRLRAKSSGDGGVTGTLDFAPNNVIWANDMYITIKHNYMFDVMYPYIDTGEIFYKDRTITYSDQNSKPKPVAILNIWPRAQRLINGEATFWLDASDSYAIAQGKTISSYSLSCYPTTDTTVTFNTSTGIGRVDITGSNPDYRWLKLTVTDSDSKTQTTWRCIFVHGETPEDTNYPHVDFEIGSYQGDWESGGWSLDFEGHDNVDLASIPDLTFATIWQERRHEGYPANHIRVNNYLFINPQITYTVQPGSPCTIVATFHAGVMKDGLPSNGDTISVDMVASGTGYTNLSDTTVSGELSISGFSLTGADCNGIIGVRENGTTTPLTTISYTQGQIVAKDSYYPANFIVFPQELIVGYTHEEDLDFDNETGTGEDKIKISTPETLLRNAFMFSIELDAASSPAYWHEYPTWLTIGRACHHIWRWHSTLLHIANVYGLTDNTDKRAAALFENGSLYTMPDTMARQHGIRAHVVSNKRGDIHLTQDTQLLLDADRVTLDVIATITPADRSGAFGFKRMPEPRVAIVHGSGLEFLQTFSIDDQPQSDTYQTLVPDVNAYCAIAPGQLPARRGEGSVTMEKQVLTSQNQLNQLVGRVFGAANNLYESVRVAFHIGYLAYLDIHLNEFWDMDVASGDTIKALPIPDMRLITRTITGKIETGKGAGTVDVTFEPEADADPGVTSECPGPASYLGGIEPVIVVNNAPGAIVTASSVEYLPAGRSTWTQRTSEATEYLTEDPYWRFKGSPASKDAILVRGGVGYIKWSDDAGVTWSTVTPGTDPPNSKSDAIAPTKTTVTYSVIKGSFRYEDEFIVLANWQNASNEWRSWLWVTQNDFTSGTWLYLGGGPTYTCEELTQTPVELDAGIDDTHAGSWYLRNRPRQICQVDTNRFVIVYLDNTSPPPYKIYVQAFETDTGEADFGSKKLTGLASQNAWYAPVICKVDTNKFAIADNYYSDPKMQLGTVAGKAITLGTAANWLSAREIAQQIGGTGGVETGNGAYKPTISAPDASTIHIGRMGVTVSGGSCLKDSNAGFHICKASVSGLTFTPTTKACDIYTVNDWDTDTTGVGMPTMTDQIPISQGAIGVKSLFASCNVGTDAYIQIGTYDSSSGMGTVSQLGIDGYPTNFSLAKLSETKAIIFVQEDDIPNYKIYAVVITISGTTVSFGTPQQIFTTTSSAMYYLQAMEISDTEAAMAIIGSGTGCTVISKVTANTVTNVISSYDTCDYTFPAVNNFRVHGFSSTHFLAFRDTATIGGTFYKPSMTIGSYAETVGSCNDQLSDFRTLHADFSHYSGNVAWVTGDNGGILELLKLNIDTPAISQRTNLGGATHDEVDARTYFAVPSGFWSSDDFVVVGGRFVSPVNGKLAHLIFTTDGGATFYPYVEDWGADHCGALHAYPGNMLFAVRNTGTRCKLYLGYPPYYAMTLMSTSPLLTGVNPGGIDYTTINANMVVLAADSGETIMVVASSPPYQVWYDLTGNHPTSNGINSIVVL